MVHVLNLPIRITLIFLLFLLFFVQLDTKIGEAIDSEDIELPVVNVLLNTDELTLQKFLFCFKLLLDLMAKLLGEVDIELLILWLLDIISIYFLLDLIGNVYFK